jgi:hypothetical protein
LTLKDKRLRRAFSDDRQSDEEIAMDDDGSYNDSCQSDDTLTDIDDVDTMRHEHPELDSSSGFAIFRCSEAQCIKWYRSIDRCEDHIATGKHVHPPAKLSLLDVAVKTFKAQTDRVFSKSTTTMPMNTTFDLSTNGTTCLSEGWALPQPKLNKRFTREQIAFLVEKYDEGERSGNKWNPAVVASVSRRWYKPCACVPFQTMRTVKHAGHLRFAPEDHLTTAQVKSYFSKLTSNRRKQSQPVIDVSSQEPMDTDESSHSQQEHDDAQDKENEDDFDSFVHEVERQELRAEIRTLLGSDSV